LAKQTVTPIDADSHYDVVVIGAGAAGMMCASVAGQRGRRVLIIDHYPKLGEKIRISGGGRCNFTNLLARPECYLSRNPDFCRSALARYGASDFIELVERHGIPYHEKQLGQLFCDHSARDIIEMLQAECDAGGVEWWMPCAVEAVARGGEGFDIVTARGPVSTRSLVVATGGLTVPKIGATPFGYRLAEQFGLAVVPPRPALVPLALDPQTLAHYGELSGVSIPVDIRCGDGRFREDLLFTHRGLSGPAALQISSYWDGHASIAIDLLPEFALAERLRSRAASSRLDNVLAEHLPRRVAHAWCRDNDAERTLAELGVARLSQLDEQLHDWRVRPSGTLGYNKAEVTLGGVDTRELSSKTMAALKVDGLFFIGEVVDVTGWLGGYNFQWAWSSGQAAGQAV
jgi:predicted Rossmann fold flavoprotein